MKVLIILQHFSRSLVPKLHAVLSLLVAALEVSVPAATKFHYITIRMVMTPVSRRYGEAQVNRTAICI